MSVRRRNRISESEGDDSMCISDHIKERWLEYLFNACESNFSYYGLDYHSKDLYIEDQELLHSNLKLGLGYRQATGSAQACAVH